MVDDSVRPSLRWARAHRCEMVSFVLIAIVVTAVSATYHAPHSVTANVYPTPAVIEQLVLDTAPCTGTQHASRLNSTVFPNGTVQYYYECHPIALTSTSWFAGFIMLCALVLMVRGYPADLVMLGATLVMFIGGVIPAAKGACGRAWASIVECLPCFVFSWRPPAAGRCWPRAGRPFR